MIYEVQAERRPKITVDVVNAVPYRGKILMLFRQRIIGSAADDLVHRSVHLKAFHVLQTVRYCVKH